MDRVEQEGAMCLQTTLLERGLLASGVHGSEVTTPVLAKATRTRPRTLPTLILN